DTATAGPPGQPTPTGVAQAAPTSPAAAAPGKYVAARATTESVYVESDAYKGPRPTTFKESPMSADLVKQGKILPLEQRLPVPADVKVYPPSDEIGVYGGVLRFTDAGNLSLDRLWLPAGGLWVDPTASTIIPSSYKAFESSDGGRVYTFTLRKGARWSDGYPVTMEDYRFAIEDLILNKALMPGLPEYVKSPITGNDFKFKVLDDLHYQISFDDPQYSFAADEGHPTSMRGCPRCFISPAHVFKRYHTKYNSAEIPDLLKKYNQPDWTKLFVTVRNVRGFTSMPSVAVPTTFDPNYIYKGEHYIPWQGFWITQSLSESHNVFTRNHYFYGVDPEGNQLPYADGVESFRVESRDVAAFRVMNSEADFNSAALQLAELPLYLTNMVKGDYSLMKYPAFDGADTIIEINQEYAGDVEIAKLLRTYDFRLALSKAWNRVAANEAFASGLAVPQNAAPHPSTAYAPEDQYRYMDIQLDVAGAKALMTKMGYKDSDGDGYLERQDGKGRLTLTMTETMPYFPYLELLQGDLKQIGIHLDIKEGAKTAIAGAPAGLAAAYTVEFYWTTHTEGGVNPWASTNQRIIPVMAHQSFPMAGTYYQTRGEKGLAPTGPDPKITDIYGKTAPEGTYPVDITGDAMRLQEIFTEGVILATLDPRKIELGKSVFRINAQDQLKPNGLAYSGIERALRIKRNNVRNVPRNATTGTSPDYVTLYFEDGTDNLYHPGNKSKKYRSVSFIDPAYWNAVMGQ
ncbi:MAG: hypothetical protein FJ319_14705, partial [SAR202 cluster bacterium]|nr:hypothetical protein [SAR202 cluster bacterium]